MVSGVRQMVMTMFVVVIEIIIALCCTFGDDSKASGITTLMLANG